MRLRRRQGARAERELPQPACVTGPQGRYAMTALWRLSALPVLLLLPAGLAQAADTKEVHKTVPLDRDGRVSIETFKGSITVTTWERTEGGGGGGIATGG